MNSEQIKFEFSNSLNKSAKHCLEYLEELHGEVLPVPGVEEDTKLLLGLDDEADVEAGHGVQRLQGDEALLGDELDGDQVLAPLA